MNGRVKTAGFAAVVFSALFQTDAAAAGGLPFGFEHDKSPSQYDYCYTRDTPDKDQWQCRSAPQTYRTFDVYNMWYIDRIGFCSITTIQEFSSPYGVEDQGMKILSQLEEIYGPHTQFSFYPDPDRHKSNVNGGLSHFVWRDEDRFTPVRGIAGLSIKFTNTMSYSSISIDFTTTKIDQCRTHEDKNERKALGG